MLQKQCFDSNFNSDTQSTSDFDNSEISFWIKKCVDSTHHQEIPLNQGSALLAASNPGWNAACIVFEQSGRWLLVSTKWTTKTSTAHMQSGQTIKYSPLQVFIIFTQIKSKLMLHSMLSKRMVRLLGGLFWLNKSNSVEQCIAEQCKRSRRSFKSSPFPLSLASSHVMWSK